MLKLTGWGEWTAEDERRAAARLERLKAEALDWLSARYQNVRPEEISEQTARDIERIREWDNECAYCFDVRKCRHSRAVLDIREEGTRDGWREFVTRARPCDRLIAYRESLGLETGRKKSA